MPALSPYLLGFLAIGCYAVLPPMAKWLQLDIPSYAFIALTMSLLAIMSAAASYFFEPDFIFTKIPPQIFMKLLLFSFINFVGFALYLAAIKGIHITEYQLIGLATPLVGSVVAYFILGEMIRPQHIVGLVIISAGLFIALRQT